MPTLKPKNAIICTGASLKKTLAVAVIVLLLPLAQLMSLDVFSQSTSSFSPTYAREDSKLIYIGNAFIELQLLKTNGGIYSIRNKMTNEDYRTDKSVPAQLFWAGEVSTAGFDSNSPSSFAYSYSTSANQSIVTLQHSFGGAHPATIMTSIRVARNSSLSFWRMSIDNFGRVPIDILIFPVVSGIAQVGNETANNYLLIGDEEGSMLTNLYSSFITNASSPDYFGMTYPQFPAPTQMIVLGNSFGGVYVSTYDTSGNAKNFYAEKPGTSQGTPTISLSVLRWLPEQVNSTVVTSYDTVLGVFKGAWYAAADMYRSWATRQWWTAQGPLYQRVDVPLWFKRGFVTLYQDGYDNMGFVYNTGLPNIGRNWEFANFSQIPLRLEQYLSKDNSPVFTILDGWEKYGEWVAPDVFPPMEGWASFNKTVAEIHAMGQHVMIGLSVNSLYTSYPGFDSTWIDCATRQENGSLLFSPAGVWLASPACPRFQDWVVSTVTRLAKAGVDSVELDGSFQYPFDFSNSTTHPPGYGPWWVSSWISILERIRSSVNRINPDFILASEGLPEIFIPWVQMYIDTAGSPQSDYHVALFGSNVRPTGLFDYVYSGYAVGFSDQTYSGSTPLPSETYNTYRDFTQALGTSLGRVVNYAGSPYNWDPPTSSLARSLCWASSYFFRDFLPFGERIPSPAISVPTVNLTFEFPSSFLPRYGQISSYTTPVVLSGAALSHDNRLGYLFVNIGNVSQSFTFSVDTSYLVQSTNLEIIALNENAVNVSAFDPSKRAVVVDLPPKETLTLEIVPSISVSKILLEYNAFKASYIVGMAVHAASTAGPNFDAALTMTMEAEDAYITQDYSRSISLSLQALNMTARTFARFGQLLTDEPAYSNCLSAFDSAAKEGNYDAAFDSAESAIRIGSASMAPLLRSIAFDEDHNNAGSVSPTRAASLSSPGRFVAFANDLNSTGYVVSSYTKSLTDTSLSRSQVLVLTLPASLEPLSPSETQAVLDFVSKGGGLLIMGGQVAPSRYTNNLTSFFGVNYVNGYVQSVNASDPFKSNFRLIDINRSHQITAGFNELWTDFAAPMVVHPGYSAEVLASTGSDTYSGNIRGPFPYLVAERYGAGRVVILADDIFADLNYQYEPRPDLAHNIMKWLSQPSAGVTLLVEQTSASAQAISFNLVRASDGSYPAEVTLTMGNSSTIVSKNGWANFTVSQKYLGTSLPSCGSGANGCLRILVANTTTSSSGARGIPEFLYQIVAIALLTLLVVASYLVVTHRRPLVHQ
jgi:hypothetical protein